MLLLLIEAYQLLSEVEDLIYEYTCTLHHWTAVDLHLGVKTVW